MPEINKELLRSKILRSRELTALEKRYLESLVLHDRRGRWVKGLADGEGYHCSRCRIWRKHIALLRFCPNCGARMGGAAHVE